MFVFVFVEYENTCEVTSMTYASCEAEMMMLWQGGCRTVKGKRRRMGIWM